MVFTLLLLLQDAGQIDAAARSVMGMDVRKWKGVDDAEYLARVTRDLWGDAPADVASFVADTTADKRKRKVDELLASPKFAAHWGRRLSLWVIGDPAGYRIDHPGLESQVGEAAATGFARWMTEGTGADRPWTETVRAILEARGDSAAVPELAWKLRFTESSLGAREKAVDMARRLLGIRLGCGVCHDHPFDRWTVEDVHRLGAFFVRERVRVPANGKAIELKVSDEGEMNIPRSPDANDKDAKVKLAQGGVAEPTFLFGGVAGKHDDRLKVLAGLMTAKANTQFPRAFANQVWASLFGKGIIHPPDDFNLRNKASSPALLDTLTRGFADGGYRLKPFLRAICATEIYACVDMTEPAKAEWSSFRGQIVRPPEHPPKPFGPLKLVIPESWTPLPRRTYYNAPFRVPGPGGPATFGFGGGSDDGLDTQIVGGKPVTTTLEGGTVKVVLKDVAGTYTCDPASGDPREKWRILAAAVTHANGVARYRLEGPAATVAHWHDAFLDLLKKAAP